MTPRYTHDCDHCVFLGTFGEADLYFADHGGVAPGYEPAVATVISRTGDDGPEYTSGVPLAPTSPPLAYALGLAVGRGLIRPVGLVPPPAPPSYEARSTYACDVCGNVPDEDGQLEHGRGCYTQDEEGGGVSYVRFDRGEGRP